MDISAAAVSSCFFVLHNGLILFQLLAQAFVGTLQVLGFQPDKGTAHCPGTSQPVLVDRAQKPSESFDVVYPWILDLGGEKLGLVWENLAWIEIGLCSLCSQVARSDDPVSPLAMVRYGFAAAIAFAPSNQSHVTRAAAAALFGVAPTLISRGVHTVIHYLSNSETRWQSFLASCLQKAPLSPAFSKR